MTREEASNRLKQWIRNGCDGMTDERLGRIEGWFHKSDKEAFEQAIKALEQEPCEDAINLVSVFEIMGNLMSIPYDFDRSITEKDVSESMDKVRELPRVTPQEPILDKIRAEIDTYLENEGFGSEYRNDVKKIFNKYKAESEDKE